MKRYVARNTAKIVAQLELSLEDAERSSRYEYA